MSRQITEEQIEELGKLADTCDNLVGAMELPLTGEAHIEALKTGLLGLSAHLKEIVVAISDDDPWKGFA